MLQQCTGDAGVVHKCRPPVGARQGQRPILVGVLPFIAVYRGKRASFRSLSCDAAAKHHNAWLDAAHDGCTRGWGRGGRHTPAEVDALLPTGFSGYDDPRPGLKAPRTLLLAMQRARNGAHTYPTQAGWSPGRINRRMQTSTHRYGREQWRKQGRSPRRACTTWGRMPPRDARIWLRCNSQPRIG